MSLFIFSRMLQAQSTHGLYLEATIKYKNLLILEQPPLDTYLTLRGLLLSPHFLPHFLPGPGLY